MGLPIKNPGDELRADEWNSLVKLATSRYPLSGNDLTPFELKSDKEPGTEAAAYPIKSDGTADTEAETFDVYDQEGGKQWRALGSDTTGSDGARGFARMGSSGHLEIVSMLEQARMCYCTAKIASGSTLSAVDNVVSMDGGQSPVSGSSDELSVSGDFETDDGAAGIIVWDETNDVWRPLDFPCASE